ncbi:MAG: NYN domain-containing protein [Candidatus Omnitrophota bacterium]
MSLHYIIDGYNVIKQVTFLTGKKLRDGRDGLVRFIEKYRPQGSAKNEVTIVFDGKAEISSPAIQSSVQVIFSKNETADDKIKRMVESAGNSRQMVIVSDDKEIMFYCRSLGANVKSVKEFLDSSFAAKNRLKPAEKIEKAELSSDIADKITEDLKKLWLNKEN